VPGRVRSWQAVPGTLYAVNRLGWTACPEVLFRNERVVVEMEVAGGERLFLALVAAWGVSRIGLAFGGGHVPTDRESSVDPALPIPVDRGEELGWFNLGSTVVLIWPSGRNPVQSVLRAGPVRVGRALARIGIGDGP
jgi:phosphatidylserine decarboxylase